ncbi:MAG: glycosyltransferase family 4 protein [Alphaproteobacteria bacterium]|nr:glycosyltransferase family 4 protein [Alphaproteobacteria bacterium]
MAGLSILQIVHDHPHWTSGGTEHVAKDLCDALNARQGVEAHLLCAATSLQRNRTAAMDVLGADSVTWVGAYDRFMMSRLDARTWAPQLRRTLAAIKPDVVHFHSLDRLGIETLAVIRDAVPQARIVVTLHDYQLICANDGLMLTTTEGARCGGASPDRCRRCFPTQSAERFALRRAYLMANLAHVDTFIAPSRFLRDKFVAWGLEPQRILVVRNATAETENRASPTLAQPEADPSRRRNRFAFFGAIASHKGVFVLLDAARRLASQQVDVTLSIHGPLNRGGADLVAHLNAEVAAAWPVATHFGPYDRADAPGLIQQADWVIAPSIWWENAPLVVLEAQRARRPVICSAIGGLAEMVRNGIDGLHVPPGDPGALAETMRTATDPEFWLRLSGAISEPRDLASFATAHLEIYGSLLEKAA